MMSFPPVRSTPCGPFHCVVLLTPTCAGPMLHRSPPQSPATRCDLHSLQLQRHITNPFYRLQFMPCGVLHRPILQIFLRGIYALLFTLTECQQPSGVRTAWKFNGISRSHFHQCDINAAVPYIQFGAFHIPPGVLVLCMHPHNAVATAVRVEHPGNSTTHHDFISTPLFQLHAPFTSYFLLSVYLGGSYALLSTSTAARLQGCDSNSLETRRHSTVMSTALEQCPRPLTSSHTKSSYTQGWCNTFTTRAQC
jgi:hypothetical protein